MKKKAKKAWAPTAITLGIGALTLGTPEIQQAIVTHPHWATGLGVVYAILKGILPSPLKQN